MNVLLATMQFGRGYAQGTERYLSILRAGLIARGHVVSVLAGDPERRGPDVAPGAARPDEPGVLHLQTCGRLAVRGRPADEYEPLLRRLQPDVLHLANPAHVGVGLAEAALRLGIPLVVTIMDFWWLCPRQTLWHADGRICTGDVSWQDCLRCDARSHPRSLLRSIARLPVVADWLLPAAYGRWGGLEPGASLEQRRAEQRLWLQRRSFLLSLLAEAAAVICPSRVARARMGDWLTAERVHEIPYGLEPTWFRDGAASDGPASAGTQPVVTPVIGYAGALAPHKAPHLLLAALRKLGWREVRVRLAGRAAEPGYARALRSLAAGLNVEFVGPLSSAEMPAFLQSLDLLVIPSLWLENLPLIVLEGLASGVDVLGSDVPGIAEILPETHCFSAGAVDELAARLTAWRAGLLPRCAPHRPILTGAAMTARTEAVYERVGARLRASK